MPYLGKTRKRIFHDNRPLQRVGGVGPIPAKVMLIGERPGEKEAKEGKPFVGASGQILNMCLAYAGMKREEVYITNLVKEFAQYDKPTKEDVERDEGELAAEMVAVEPEVIGAIGTYAVEWLMGRERAQLERTHGVPEWYGENGNGTIVVPMYHPANAIYNMDMFPLVLDDFNSLRMVVEGKLQPTVDEWAGREEYKTDPLHEVTVWADEIAVDTEGSAKRPWCLTYAVVPGQALLAKPGQIFRFVGRVWLHNSLHDLAVLRAMGVKLADDQFRDTMVYAYLLCLEPQGLKDLAYRHAGMTMMSYQDVIAEAEHDKALEYLIGVDANEWEKAEPYVTVEAGITKIKKPQSINQRVRRILNDVDKDKRNKAGDPVDPRERWGNIDDFLKQEVVEALGEMPEATLDDVDPDVAEWYANRDADATLRIAPILEAKIDEMGLRGVAEIDHAIIPMVDKMMEVGILARPRQFWDKLEDKCDAIMGQQRHLIYNATGWDINPDSPKQTAELLFSHLHLPVTHQTEGGDASTKDKALESIVSLHPVVDMVLVYREASKIKSSYVRPIRRLGGDERGDGRIHSTMRITRVTSGRLAASKPNLMAIPVRTELGKEVREGFIAPPGRILGDWDLSQIEMRWMANESRDKRLIGLFRARDKDVHIETAATMFGVGISAVLDVQRYAAKRVGFGVITGITEYGLVDQMALARAKRPDGEAWTVDDCAQMIEAWFQMYPGAREYFDNAGKEAEQNNGMVRDKWKRIRYLPGVFSPIPAVAAEARRQASSHKIQAGAQGYMKVAMARMWKGLKWIMETPGVEVWPLLQIHDSVMWELPDEEEIKEEVGQTVERALTNGGEELDNGVPVEAKGGFGYTWKSLK